MRKRPIRIDPALAYARGCLGRPSEIAQPAESARLALREDTQRIRELSRAQIQQSRKLLERIGQK
jgi:hypothetical protein